MSGTLCGAGDKRVKKKQIHTTSDFNDENTSAEHQRDQGLLDKEKATKKKRSLTVKEKQVTNRLHVNTCIKFRCAEDI